MKDLDYNELQKVLTQKFLLVSKPLIKQLGLEAAAWIADMLSKFNYFEKREMIDSQGWFYNTQQNIREDTSIAISAQAKIIRELQDRGVLEFEKRGVPAKNYYKFNFRTIIDLITSTQNSDTPVSAIHETSIANSPQPVSAIHETSIANSPQYNKNKDNKNKDNKNKLNNTCSKEQVIHFDSQSDPAVSKKSTLIRKGLAKSQAKEIPIDKPLNGPYKKIFDYWQLSGLRSPKTNTKIHEKNVVALRSLLREYSIDKIIKSIDLLKLALSLDYTPASLKAKEYYRQLYFSEFVHNERTGQSLFKELQEKPPKLLKNTVTPVDESNSDITNFLKNFYIEKVLGNADIELTTADENVFRLATKKLIKFHEKNQGKYPTPWFGVGDVARLYTDAIVDYVDKYKKGNMRMWSVMSFQWDDFFNKHLPAYMFDQAMLVKPHIPNPLNM